MEVLHEVLDVGYRGPKAMFTEIHVLKAILAIGGSKSVGRGRLGVLLGLGQGEVRTLIRRLKEKGLISVDAEGCRLTARGRGEFSSLTKLISWSSPVEAKNLGIGEDCWAVLVRRGGDRVRFGIEQRDAAVRAGARGALTAVFSSGRFTLPGEGTDCEGSGEEGLWRSVRSAHPDEGDVVVVSGSDDASTAEWGALAAALTFF